MKNIVFLIHDSARNWGSTIIRTQHMAALAIDLFGAKGMNVSFTANYRDVKDAIVIVHKTFFAESSSTILDSIRRRGNIIIADYIDQPVNDIESDLIDGLMASSRKQEAFFRQKYPSKPVFHVTHTVDLRIQHFDPPEYPFRLGYFGAKKNALYDSELTGLVDFIETTPDDTHWMAELKNYNCHYAVRNRQSWDGFKPFLKGFTAAKYGTYIRV